MKAYHITGIRENSFAIHRDGTPFHYTFSLHTWKNRRMIMAPLL